MSTEDGEVPDDPGTGSPPGLDLPAAGRWLRETLPDLFHGPLQARLATGEPLHLTYVLDADGGRRVVLRRRRSGTCCTPPTTWPGNTA